MMIGKSVLQNLHYIVSDMRKFGGTVKIQPRYLKDAIKQISDRLSGAEGKWSISFHKEGGIDDLYARPDK